MINVPRVFLTGATTLMLAAGCAQLPLGSNSNSAKNATPAIKNPPSENSSVTAAHKAELVHILAKFADFNSKEQPVEKFDRYLKSKGTWTLDQETKTYEIYEGLSTTYGIKAH
jgi:hypothetical protein